MLWNSLRSRRPSSDAQQEDGPPSPAGFPRLICVADEDLHIEGGSPAGCKTVQHAALYQQLFVLLAANPFVQPFQKHDDASRVLFRGVTNELFAGQARLAIGLNHARGL